MKLVKKVIAISVVNKHWRPRRQEIRDVDEIHAARILPGIQQRCSIAGVVRSTFRPETSGSTRKGSAGHY